jgi:hypothetical protein
MPSASVIFFSTLTRTQAGLAPVFLTSAIFVTDAPGITPVTPSGGKGFVFSASAYSATSTLTPPVVMTFRVLVSAVK